MVAKYEVWLVLGEEVVACGRLIGTKANRFESNCAKVRAEFCRLAVLCACLWS